MSIHPGSFKFLMASDASFFQSININGHWCFRVSTALLSDVSHNTAILTSKKKKVTPDAGAIASNIYISEKRPFTG